MCGALVRLIMHACSSSSNGSTSSQAQGQPSPAAGHGGFEAALRAIREASGITAVGEDCWSLSEQQIQALGLSLSID